jgi:hypoxanthine phosphoribosyltransferase
MFMGEKEMNKDVARILISEEEIRNKSKELGMLITEEYKDKKAPILIALLKGSVPFLAELIKHIDLDIEYDFMDVSSILAHMNIFIADESRRACS